MNQLKAKNNARVFVAILTLALLVRITSILEFGASAIRFGDAPDYLAAATTLCSAGSYPNRSSMPFFRAPGLPVFIAAETLCHPDLTWLVKVGLALVDVASVAILMLLAQELFGDAKVSRVCGACAAIYPFFIAQVCDVQTEALFMLLYLVSVWLTLTGSQSGKGRLTLLAGACAAAAALVRPVGLLLVLLVPPLVMYPHRPKRIAPLLATFAIGWFALLGPWVIRNEVRYHELILVNDAGGYNFWRGTSPEMEQINRSSSPGTFSSASTQFESMTSLNLAREIEARAKTPAARSREWFERGFANFRAAPLAFAIRLGRNALAYWRPWLQRQTHSRRMVLASGVAVSAIYILALIGWNILRKRDAGLAWWFATCALVFWIAQIPFQVTSRFRIPIEDPVMIVFASAACCAVLRRYMPSPAEVATSA